ncbi:hypothetical protein EZV62_016888 [Acer yangbiense]|uniref:DUF7086 domain-containing protein n=1 Tax=Acer yangbiense TaxID=1000413 RepID=A0A5C7HQG1_9ROSI|nr:hypothetical protein EZV62_016888 [Acer yangbiense]
MSSKEDLHLELSLSSCTPPPTTTSSMASSVSVSVSTQSPFKLSPPPPPPRCITSPPPQHYQHHYFMTEALPPPPSSPPPPPHHYNNTINSSGGAPLRGPTTRTRRSPVQTFKPGKTETVDSPYPWATTKRATVHSLDYLISNNINMISGEVQCKRCEKIYQIEYDLREKFMEIAMFITKNKSAMHHRAPAVWMNPNLPSCKFCGQNNCVRPLIDKKKSLNWLFLLLGKMLGCCKLEQLKYFCKHTKNHRTGAKDRVLYLTYLGLCKQLDPTGPFDAV